MKIGLVGTFDVENFGDCMFPELYAHLLREPYPEAQITLYSPTARPAQILSFDEVKALPATPQTAQFDEDVVILTGGETIGQGHSTGVYVFPIRTLSAALRLWLGPVLATAQSETRFVAHCVGATTIPAELTSYVGRLLAAADYVTFRDQTSFGRFPEQADTLHIATDPMFLLSELLTPEAWASLAAPLLPDGLQVGDYFVAHITASYINSGIDVWAKQIAQIAQDTGKRPLLVPICHFLHDDIVLTRAGAHLTQIGCSWSAQLKIVNVKDTAALIAASSGYVGTSLHGAVSAVSFAKPLAVLTGDHESKHEGTLRQAGIMGVTTPKMGSLADIFAASAAGPLIALRDTAMTSARQDFAQMIEVLNSPRVARLVPQDIDVTAIAAADRSRVKGLKTHIHRFALAILQWYRPGYDAYKKLRLARKVAAS